MNKAVNKDWLSLSDVAERLGVHPSTVRAWSDQGVLPVYRTKGGHRRYLLDEINLWLETSRQNQEVAPERALRHVLNRIRFQIGENRLQEEVWYQKLDDDARRQYRMSGKTLLQSLANYLNVQGDDAIAEARSLGYEYASRGRRYGLCLLDATRAFLFFRNLLLEAMTSVYLDSRVTDVHAWGDMLARVHAFTDQTMLSLLETYQAFENNGR